MFIPSWGEKLMLGDISERSYAGLRPRVLAFALDYMLICSYIVVLATVSTLLRRGPLRQQTDPLFATPTRRDVVAFLTLILPVMLYFTYCESSPQQATWGKRKIGLHVVDFRGGRLSRTRALARTALKFLPWQVAHTALFHIPGWPLVSESVPATAQAGLSLVWGIVGAYLFSMLTNKQHRTLYDRIAGSMVTKEERHSL